MLSFAHAVSASPASHTLRAAAHLPTAPRAKKPRNYWRDRRNLALELHLFVQQHGTSCNMPTAAQLLAAGRVDLLRAVQRHGGFATIAAHAGLIAVRRHRRFDHLQYVRLQLLPLFRARVLSPGVMPSASQLRAIRRADLIPCIAAAGGFCAVASKLRLLPARLRRRQSVLLSPSFSSACHTARSPLLPLAQPAYGNRLASRATATQRSPPPKRKRRRRHYWNVWRNFESELRAFALKYCHGNMPLQRHFIEAKRTDLLNALRIHGGVANVARRVGLVPPYATMSKRPHGYWNDPAVLHAQLLTFAAKNGYPGLMPTRRQLREAGRMDIAYAVEKHGGYATIASTLHLMWHGPCSYWRVFKNLEKRLMAYIRSKRLKDVMPFLETLYKDGRMDLVYGIARHDGVMNVAKRIGLKVEFPYRKPHYWERPYHLQRELENFLRMQPLEARQYMPTSVAIVQSGRADLATAIRDRGGWVYYAQRLGLRFGCEVRPQGFWQRESNVLLELKNYMLHRYGSWEHPGKPLSEGEKRSHQRSFSYIPSIDMLKRDGRSDIAFAVERYHGGIAAFAFRNGFDVAEDVVPIMHAEDWMLWKRFASALRSWIAIHGSNGIMPTTQDLIRTGRHDLRYGVYKHGGAHIIAKRLQLVCTEHPVHIWLPSWLGIQAAKLGLVLNMMHNDHLPRESRKIIVKLERDLASAVLGQWRRMMTTTMGSVVHDKLTSSSLGGRGKRRKRVGLGHSRVGRTLVDCPHRLTPKELEKLRARYRHLPPDDIITV